MQKKHHSIGFGAILEFKHPWGGLGMYALQIKGDGCIVIHIHTHIYKHACTYIHTCIYIYTHVHTTSVYFPVVSKCL